MAKKEEKVAQILDAAAGEFLAKGLDAASMHNIAERAAVSKRTLYKYYSGKDELYSALIDELLDRVRIMHQIKYDPDQPVRQQLEKIVEYQIDLTTSESFINMSKIVIGEILKDRKPTDDQMNKMFESELMFVDWVNGARKDNKITSDLDSTVIADQFHSIMKGQIFFPVLFRFLEVEKIDSEGVRDKTVDFFINSFCG